MKLLSLMLPLALSTVALAPWRTQEKPADNSQLNAVLAKMDAAAATFRTARADFEWDRYEKVIDEIDDVQKGTVYYRRTGKDKEIEMKADVKKAGSSADTLKDEPKYVLVSEGKIKMYEPKPDQVTVYDMGKKRSEFESYVVLGFGGSGQELVKQFDVSYGGQENINGITTAKLQLIPKSEVVRNNFKQIILWIDLDRGISVQQQLFDLQGDYRLAKYFSIKLNEKVADDVFKLKTTGKTKTVTAGG
jgi:outer membrane lipoprotein-sorting protein